MLLMLNYSEKIPEEYIEMENVNEAVSIIEFVDDLVYAKSIFHSYMLQNIRKKELILVYTGTSDDFEKWLSLTRVYPMTRIYQLNNGSSLGECLNYCAERSIFENIAVFSEVGLYDHYYLLSSLKAMQSNQVQLVGKRTYYRHDEKKNDDILVNPGFEDCMTDYVILPSFVIRHDLFDSLRFDDGNDDIDIEYCKKCRACGYGIYSAKVDGLRLY